MNAGTWYETMSVVTQLVSMYCTCWIDLHYNIIMHGLTNTQFSWNLSVLDIYIVIYSIRDNIIIVAMM